MKMASYRVSKHCLQKHVYGTEKGGSLFFSTSHCYSYIDRTMNVPDFTFKTSKDNKIKFIKMYSWETGIKEEDNINPRNSVTVVLDILRNTVITAFPSFCDRPLPVPITFDESIEWDSFTYHVIPHERLRGATISIGNGTSNYVFPRKNDVFTGNHEMTLFHNQWK